MLPLLHEAVRLRDLVIAPYFPRGLRSLQMQTILAFAVFIHFRSLEIGEGVYSTCIGLEWVVFLPLHHSLAAQYSLYPIYKEEFHQIFAQHSEQEEFKDLMVRMKVVDANGESSMDEEQWEAASEPFLLCIRQCHLQWMSDIYIGFAFEKR